MPNDSPSPLALAREAEETAHKAWVRKGMQPALDEYTAWRAAHRAHREALVEATLRWADRNMAFVHPSGEIRVYSRSLGPPKRVLTFAEVYAEIEEG